jgi:hypothetical protein
LRAKRWKRLNLVCNAKEKTSYTKWKDGMVGSAKNHAPTPRPTQDFNYIQHELKAMSKMMLEKGKVMQFI